MSTDRNDDEQVVHRSDSARCLDRERPSRSDTENKMLFLNDRLVRIEKNDCKTNQILCLTFFENSKLGTDCFMNKVRKQNELISKPVLHKIKLL